MTVQTLAQPAQKANTIETTSIIPKSSTWQAEAARRLDEIQRAIPKEYIVPPHLLETTNKARLVQSCGLLTTRELSITALSAVKLLECIHNRTFTAVEVTRAFCKSAAVAHQAVRD
jgi:amidase